MVRFVNGNWNRSPILGPQHKFRWGFITVVRMLNADGLNLGECYCHSGEEAAKHRDKICLLGLCWVVGSYERFTIISAYAVLSPVPKGSIKERIMSNIAT